MAGKNQLATTKQAPGLDQALERGKVFWTGLRPQQQAFFGVGLAITLAAIIFFVKMISTPDYKPLMSGLEPADAQSISSQLTAKKIASIISPDGTTISVPSDQVDAARLEIASHDTPHSGRIGFEIFDKVSWGQTEFDEKVNYQRALEGELERTIQTISNIKSARVHLVMASDSVFLDRTRGAKASVTLRLRRGNLSREDYAAISRLVAGAVDELKPSDVVIIDADSNQSLAQGGGAGAGSEGLEQDLTRRLIATLSPVVGADRIRASVNVEYETGSSEENQEKYDPAVSAVLTMQHSEELTGPGAGASGVPGTTSNVPGAKPSVPAAKDPSQSSKTDNNTYGVNRTTRHVIEPAGGIRRLTAAVVIDDAVTRAQQNGKWVETRHKRTPEELKLIGDLAQASIGFNSTRGDVVSIQNLSFDHPEAAELGPVNFVEKARKGMNDYSAFVRYAVLLGLFVLVYLLTIRPIQKRILSIPNSLLVSHRAPVQAVAASEEEPVLEPASNLAKRSMLLKKQLAEFVQAEPESSTIAVRAWLREETQ
jgi:flagellar M-ring protein FliF